MARATLDGVILGGTAPIVWELRRGVTPYTTTVVLDREFHRSLSQKTGRPLTLDLGHGRVFQGVYIVQTSEADAEHRVSAVLADSRWKWKYKWISRDYNISRRIGNVRLIGDGALEARVPQVDISFKPYTLKEREEEYTVKDVLEEIFEVLGEKVDIPRLNRSIELQDLPINATADAAIIQALSYAPGYEIMPMPNGKYALTDALEPAEENLIKSAGTISQKARHHTVSIRSALRPKKVEVFHQIECELRFDFHEDPTVEPSVARGQRKRPPRRLDNVIRVPDLDIEVGGRRLGRGSIAEMEEYLLAVIDDWSDVAPKRLTLATLREYYNAPWYLDHLYTRDASGNVDQKLAMRMKAILRDFRRTFQIHSAWMDQIASIRPYRLGTIDYESGTRGPAQAFMDYTVVPSHHGLHARKRGDNVFSSWVVEGYADELADARVAPAEVRVLDPDMGLIRVWLLPDEGGMGEKMVPGEMELPVLSAGQRDQYQGADSVYAFFHAGQPLAKDFSIAIVFTAIPGAPNDERRHHKTVVRPREAERLLGVPIGKADGPVKQVMIPPTPATTARYLWLDRLSGQIDDAFYGDGEWPEEALSNSDHVEALAEGVAAEIYAYNRDRRVGSPRVEPNGSLLPVGSCRSVRHVIEARSGDTYTQLIMTEPRPPGNPWTFVPPEVQAQLRGLTQP